MAVGTFDKIIDTLIDVIEKGFSNRPKKADPGGPTNLGITLKTLRAWRNDKTLGIADVQALTKDEAIEIYRAQYWNPIRGDELPLGVDWAVFDFAVNSGPGRAVRELQELLRVKQDGIIGLITLNAIRNYPGREHKLIADYSQARLDFMKTLSNWPYNKNGWTKRVKKVMSESQSLRILKDHKPDMAEVETTPKADSQNLSVSKALICKENVTVLTVAIPAVSGLLSDFQPAQYAIAAFIAGFGVLALYWGFKRIKNENL